MASVFAVTVNGLPASTVPRGGARGARCIWRWTPRRATSARWKSPSSRQGDSPSLPELSSRIPDAEEIGAVTADGAYDTRRCHVSIRERDVEPFGCSFGSVAVMPSLPIRRIGRAWKPDRRAAISRNEISRTSPPEEMGGIPCPKSCRGPDEPPKALRGADHVTRSRPPDCRGPDPHRHHDPLPGPRKGRDQSRRLKPAGKPARQRAPLLQRFAAGRLVRGLVVRRMGSAHALRLPCWLRDMNSPPPLRNKTLLLLHIDYPALRDGEPHHRRVRLTLSDVHDPDRPARSDRGQGFKLAFLRD